MSVFPFDKIPKLEDEKPMGFFNSVKLANQAWHCRHDDLWPPKAGQHPPTEDQLRAINLYLGNFCRPVKSIANEVICVACNATLTLPYATHDKHALIVDTTSKTLEARCGGCGYPVRARHFINLAPPNEHIGVVKLDFFPLCYHPRATQSLLN